MFAWIYLKDDKWVIGTGTNENPLEYVDRFFNYVKENMDFAAKSLKKKDSPQH